MAQCRILAIHGTMWRKPTLNASWYIPAPELLHEDIPLLPPLLIDNAWPTTLRGSPLLPKSIFPKTSSLGNMSASSSYWTCHISMEICGYSSQGNAFKTILDQSAVNKMKLGQKDENNKTRMFCYTRKSTLVAKEVWEQPNSNSIYNKYKNELSAAAYCMIMLHSVNSL